MRNTVLFVTLLFLTACENKNEESQKETTTGLIQFPETDLKTYLDTAGTVSVNAISNAVLFYQRNYLPTSPVSCDSHLVMLKNFSLRVTDDLNMNNVLAEYISPEGDIEPATEKKFKKLGLLIAWSEGMPYFVLDAGYLRKSISKCLSRPMASFMEEFEKENQEIAVEDGGIMISTEELARRLMFWDAFLSDHKNFILEDEARATYNFYLDLYTTGLDNTPAFDPFSGDLNNDLKNSYSKIIKSNPGRKTTDFMREYYSVLAENGFQMNEEVSEFIRTKKSPY